MTLTAPSLPSGARRGLLLATVITLTTAFAAPADARTDPGVHSFDIPAQGAADALVALCLRAGCELALVGQTSGARASAVRGRMPWRTAVETMLRGSGLRHRFIGERGVRVWAEAATLPPRPAAPAPPAVMAEVEALVVVGPLSAQIEESLRRKRKADVISDGTSATRIGELPAANLAEALQRVPGVAIEREVGEGQFVSVRGLGPLFQSVTLNGAPIAFNENIRNSTQSGRQFRFRALSPDLLAGARLTKSSTPDLVEGGIGSNIDLETIGGLDGAPFLTARLGGEAEARTRRLSPDLSLAGRAVSPDQTMGIVGGVSIEAREVLYDRFQIQRYRPLVIAGRTVAAPNDVRTTVEHEDRLRRSAFLGLDWRPSDDFAVDIDALASTFDNRIREDRLVFGLGERLLAPGSTTTIRRGVVTAAEVANGQIDNNTEFSDQAHLNLALSVGVEARWREWTITPRLSLSRAVSVLDTPQQRISARSPPGVAYGFDLGDGAADDRRVARLSTSFDLLDPGLLGFQRFGVRAIESEDDDATAMIAARRPVDWRWNGVRITEVALGGQAGDRGRDYQRRDREAALRPGAAVTADFYGVTVPADVFRQLVSARTGPWTAAAFAAFRDAFLIPGETNGVIVRPGDLKPTGADRQSSYRVGEGIAAAYARLDFEGEAGAVPYSGNLGLRWVETRTQVDGSILTVGAGGGAEVLKKTHAGDHAILLPSANVALELGGGQLLRLALSRSLTRPSLADLRAATAPASTLVNAIYDRGQAEIDNPSPGTIFTGVGGNPALEPYVSTNYDLSWEWSFPRGALNVAAFHKRIDNFILAVETREQLVFETRAGPPVVAEVLMSRPRNAGRAEITGLEVGFHRRFESGFGLWANATWTHSEATENDTGRRQDLPGVSDVAYSINPFLERGPVTVSLSWSWRSAFRSEADMQGGGVSDFTIGSAGYLDAQATYDVSRRLQLVATASNITDTIDLAYEGTPDRLLQLGRAGRAFSFGIRWVIE